MSPVWIVLLVCTLARADRYADYAAVNMPQYSMEEGGREAVPQAEEYPERAPDADGPLPFDYKYEEELQDKENKVRAKFEEENWRKQNENLKDPQDPPDNEQLEKHEEVPKFKESHKNRRYRTRIKNKEIHREEKYYKQRAPKVRNRRIDKVDVDSRNEYYANKDRIQEDNKIEPDDGNFRLKTEKVVRRKPRDRRINLRRLDVDDEDDEEDSKSLERDEVKPSRSGDANVFERDNDADYVENRGANSQRFMVERPSRPVSEKTRMRNKNYPEYDDDYYDMKRVNHIKNKLPDLLRRTQASTTETTSTRRMQDFTYRSAYLPERTTQTTTTTKTSTETTMGTKPTNVTNDNASETAINSDLSLAEKSRLSILKKAQRKNDVKNVARTTKPPVLMQVTRRAQTLVMVEPPHADVRLRAREVFDESPERIAKAKKLMRKKLVAGARSIHDLTDRWDEMVCDYVDVTLLDGSPSAYPTLELPFLSLLSLMCSYYIFI